jgi:hypothetical protein
MPEINEKYPWKPTGGEGWWNRLVCDFKGHDKEETHSEKFMMDNRVMYESDPICPPGHVIFETKYTLYQIDEVVNIYYKCKRCGAVWKEHYSYRTKPPMECSKWNIMRVDGRVILPKKKKE